MHLHPHLHRDLAADSASRRLAEARNARLVRHALGAGRGAPVDGPAVAAPPGGDTAAAGRRHPRRLRLRLRPQG